MNSSSQAALLISLAAPLPSLPQKEDTTGNAWTAPKFYLYCSNYEKNPRWRITADIKTVRLSHINGTTNFDYVQVMKKWKKTPGENVRMLFHSWDKEWSLLYRKE